MNCAWCSPSDNGTDGICDACMLLHFGVDPAAIHEEMAIEDGHLVVTPLATSAAEEEREVVNV